jgi:hypothetical protein
MAKKKKDAVEEPIEGVENLLSRTENYIEENQKSLTIIVTAIVVVVLGYLGYTNFYVAPLEKKQERKFIWLNDILSSTLLILPFMVMEIIRDLLILSMNTALTIPPTWHRYYAGISFLRSGEYHDAIDYLTKFDSNDQLVSPIA